MLKPLAMAAAASALLAASAAAQQPLPSANDPYRIPTPSAPASPAPTAPPLAGKAGRPHGRFAMMDTDRDGRVTLQEFIAFQGKVFDRIDVGHKGQITQADVAAFIAQRQAEEAGRLTRGRGGKGGDAGNGQLAKLSDRLAGGGVITRQQWDQTMARRFARLDVSHAGFLTADAFQPMKGDGGQNEQ